MLSTTYWRFYKERLKADIALNMLRNVKSRTPSLNNRHGVCVCVCSDSAVPQDSLAIWPAVAVAPRTTPGVNQLLVVILTMEDIKKAIGEAEKELEVAERLVASKRSALMASVFCSGGC